VLLTFMASTFCSTPSLITAIVMALRGWRRLQPSEA